MTLIVVLVWLFTSLACNYPVAGEKSQGISSDELRQTLAARPSITAQEMSLPHETIQEPASSIEATQTSVFPFVGLHTATPGSPLPGDSQGGIQGGPDTFIYYAQSGDTLQVIAKRFNVSPDQITSPQLIPKEAFLIPGQQLSIPNILDDIPYPSALLPDSEVINSPSVVNFDLKGFIIDAGGYLSTYGEEVYGEWVSGADIIQRVALESSVNPRFLLAFLEFRSHWVLGQPTDSKSVDYPIGFHASGKRGLYQEVVMTATHLNAGYYGWRLGTQAEIEFPDDERVRISPELNAGSVAIQHLFSLFYKREEWYEALYGVYDFPGLYEEMFGDAWARATSVEPLFPVGLNQPTLELPFAAGERWSLTGGPHFSWNTGSPRGALDLAPVTGEPECAVSRAWVTASAPGIIVRSDHNVVVIDIDGDGYEQTGWVILYLHIAEEGAVEAGIRVFLDDPLGHPSCERGKNTGTHVHIARKYNGEWLPADGPLPFILSGWKVHAGSKNYQGELRKGDQTVVASPVGPETSIIIR